MKGPVGTQQDQLDLLGGDLDKLDHLEAAVAAHLGFAHVLDSVGQVYPRSLDLDVVSALVQAASGPASLATTIRLMAGQELATEGFEAGQVGSSAMPHKMNTPLLRAHQRLPADPRAATSPWSRAWPATSGTRATSAARSSAGSPCPTRSSPPRALFETLLAVLDGFGAYPAVDRRRARALPAVPGHDQSLVAAVTAGVGREAAHEVIKDHAVAVGPRPARRRRPSNDLLDRLAADDAGARSTGRPLGRCSATRSTFVGDARRQTPAFVARVGDVVADPPAGRRLRTRGRSCERSSRGCPTRGKVRDIYDAGDGRLLIVASDRMSAFDVVHGRDRPGQGPGAHRHLGVLVRAARRRAAEPPRGHRRPRPPRRVGRAG